MYYAHTVNVRTGQTSVRDFPTAEVAARNLVVLLRADGWSVDKDATVARLVRGEVIRHKLYAYSVSATREP